MLRNIGICLVLLGTYQIASAESLIWDFSSDEQQVHNGPEADGSTNSPGVGNGHVEYDTATNVLSYTISWENLVGDLTKLHIHGPADASSSNPQHILEIFGPPEVPAELATTSGTVTESRVLETLIQPGFDPITPAEIITIMRSGQAYLNVHTSVFGGGEIRGNLGIPVPEPVSANVIVGLGLILLPQLRKRRRRS